MKRIVICLVVVLLFVGAANAQMKSMIGTVVDVDEGTWQWQAIVVKVGDKRYHVYTSSTGSPTLKIVGRVDEVGRTVQVFYKKIDNSSGYDGEVMPTKIVEVKKSKSPMPASEMSRGGGGGSSELQIGTIDNSNYQYLDGCGCYLKAPSASRSSNTYIFLAEIANPNVNRAWVNVDGRITVLNFVSSTRRSGRARRGNTFTETYRSGDVTARVSYIVTSPSRPGGEVTKYSATIAVTKGSRRQTVKAAGECGC
jgi:hypothetical protein